MFQGIHFKNFSYKTDLSDLRLQLQRTNTFPEAQIPLPEKLSDYEYDSEIRYHPLGPVSQFALDNYLYVQGFGLFKSNERYFTKRQNYQSYEIISTYQGTGILEYEGKTYHLTEDTGIFFDCRKPHYYHTGKGPWLHGDFHFCGHLADALYPQFSQNNSILFQLSEVPSYQIHLETILRLYDLFPYYTELQVSNELHQILTELIISTTKNNTASIPLIENLRYLQRYMQNNYQSPLTLDFLAEFSGISKYHLCREFKRYIGFTPNDYLNRLRIEQAKSLLTTTTVPIYKIAELVGIPNDDTFMYHFKKGTGLTPSEYRKRLQLESK